ncbi:ABC transporter ATP-binding protein [Jonesiaceae bacterium BS-20]|uniref:ABC transporter ATP-binding protein n=1 Tax=Jonesiaceae bacterium BS-20 TaxID=3120821 RepID=A0AAU7DUY7_9MICO
MTESSPVGSSPDARFEAALKESAARKEEIRVSGRRPSEIISTTNVSRQFGQFFAVNGANLSVDQGSITALIGPNGSGKTTLMLMLAGLLAPTQGQISINGFNPVTHNYEARSQIGWMPDQFGMWDSLTGREALITTGATYRMDSFASQQRAQELLELVHLVDLADQPAHVLSRGQKQRLGLARALMHSPKILILDEPANGLDPRSRIELRGIIRHLADQGTTVLISSHVLAELDEMVDDAIFISAGRTVAYESVSHARSSHSTWQVRALDPNALTTWLDTVHVPFAKNQDGSVLVSIAGEENAARFLVDAVGASVPLVAFAPHGGALEQTYLSLNEERK